MQLDKETVREIKTGKKDCIGDQLWVCDYRQHVPKKPTRHVRPTLVEVVDNKFIPPKKRADINSTTHLRPVKGPGLLSNTVIKYEDNECYGQCVKLFTTEEECVDFYRKQCDDIIAAFDTHIEWMKGAQQEVVERHKKTIKG